MLLPFFCLLCWHWIFLRIYKLMCAQLFSIINNIASVFLFMLYFHLLTFGCIIFFPSYFHEWLQVVLMNIPFHGLSQVYLHFFELNICLNNQVANILNLSPKNHSVLMNIRSLENCI